MNFRYIYLASFFTAIIFSSNLALAALPANYQSLKKEEKLELLWEQIETSEWEKLPALNNQGWSSILKNLGALLSLKQSFDHSSDEIPKDRPKFIHTYGSVVQVTLIPEGNSPFSGIYEKGAIGLARLSLAASPEAIAYTPGMAIKFLVDANPSVNLHVMNSLNGQGDNWNFFAMNFSNKIDPAEGFILKVLEKVFERARKPANDLPVDHLAQIYQDGTRVSSIVAPERLVLKPSSQVAGLISPSSREDFREHLSRVPVGTDLYEIYGVLKGKEIKIGRLQSSSEMIASKYGDKTLFFQHKR